MNQLSMINDILIEQEFNGLNPLECLLKIMRENKEHKEKQGVDNDSISNDK